MILVYKQIWKIIEGYPDYEISNYGTVKCWKNNRWGRGDKFRILKSGKHTKNYPAVNLCFDKKRKSVLIHRLVLKHFGPPQPTQQHECCHDDGKPHNTHILNLRWGTRQENQADRIKHGTSNRGERSALSKLKSSQVLEIRDLLKRGVTQVKIASKFNVCLRTIAYINSGETWK